MISRFDPQKGLIVVYARVQGPSGKIIFKLALDTGATDSMLSPAKLAVVGYDFSAICENVPVTTGSGIAYAPITRLDRMEALGQERANFPVLAYALPPSATVDGVLGLDFLRGQNLTLDFRAGLITFN